MLKYSANLRISWLARLAFLLPFVVLSATVLWYSTSLQTLAFSAIIFTSGMLLALRIRPRFQKILFDDLGAVRLQGEIEYHGQMQPGCQIWPWLLVLRLNNEQQSLTFLVYADGIYASDFRRLARIINLNQFSY